MLFYRVVLVSHFLVFLSACSDLLHPDKDAVRPSIAKFALVEPAEGASSLEIRVAEKLIVPALGRGEQDTDYTVALRCAHAVRFVAAAAEGAPSGILDQEQKALGEAADRLSRRAERLGLEEGIAPADIRQGIEDSEILLEGVAATPEEKVQIALSCIQSEENRAP